MKFEEVEGDGDVLAVGVKTWTSVASEGMLRAS